jgi:cytochrome c oxidase subunit 2
VAVAAPSLEGVYGSEVDLEGGETVVADEAYLRESILSPGAKIVRGYQPIMPDFSSQLSEAEVEALVGYIRALGE